MTTVLFFARARELVGAKSQAIAGDTVAEVLETASRQYGSEFAELLESCTVMVDDDVIRRDQHASHPAGDQMAVLPPVSGGSEEVGPAGSHSQHGQSQHGCEPHDGHGTGDPQLRVAVLTVSDRASVGTYEDRTGPAIEAALERFGVPGGSDVSVLDTSVLDTAVRDRRVVADDWNAIAGTLIEWCDSGAIDLVLTNGGTGLSPRDVTPEVTRQIVDVEAPGIAELMRSAGLRSTPLAALSRQVVGRRGNTIVVNLPGSTRGAVESLEAIASILPHACLMARTEVW
ncbi:MAG: molybdenum cofactor synthesis domain-containing protein [Microthrixaceae bacterium]